MGSVFPNWFLLEEFPCDFIISTASLQVKCPLEYVIFRRGLRSLQRRIGWQETESFSIKKGKTQSPEDIEIFSQ